MPRLLRYVLIAGATLIALVAGGYFFALHSLERQVIRLLGTQSEYASLNVSLHTIVIEGLHIRADPDRPWRP